MSKIFNVLMCKFDKCYICAVVGIIIEYIVVVVPNTLPQYIYILCCREFY